MAEIINLRMARKSKARDDSRAEGAANATKHGRTAAQKAREAADAARAKAELDGKKREEKGKD